MDELTIHLPPSLKTQLQERIRDTEFESLEAYVLFVLGEIVAADSSGDEPQADDAHSRELEDRLEDLGYL